MKGFIRIANVTFDLNDSSLYSYVTICESDENLDTYMFGIEASFKKGMYENKEVSPIVSTYFFETQVDDISKIIGMTFEINNIHESLGREDNLYLLGKEAFNNYKINVLEIDNNEMHLEMIGSIVKDVDAWPRVCEDFIMDVWLKIDMI